MSTCSENAFEQQGIKLRGDRNTALIRLASELPSNVLADLRAVDISTATRWSECAKQDWQAYLELHHQAGGPTRSARGPRAHSDSLPQAMQHMLAN